MPVLYFKDYRLAEHLGLSINDVLRYLERLKGEVLYHGDRGVVEVEFEIDRPDLYTVEGIGRAVRGLLGWERGLPRYRVVDSGYEIVAEDVPSRPYVAGAVVWDVGVDEDFIEELIQFQEKLHLGLGSRRRNVAIGLHDLDTLPSRRIVYKMGRVDNVVFKPLGGDKEMTLREVLSETEQGREYGGISLLDDKHPVLYSGDEVISVPPVINAELTRIKPGTKNVFIDVTGVNKRLVLDVLSVIAANLAERSTSKTIGLVRVTKPGAYEPLYTEPRMEPRRLTISINKVSALIGARLGASEAADLLERARLSVVCLQEEGSIEVLVPRYRVDIINWSDIAEEILVVKGIEWAKPRKPKLLLRGGLMRDRVWARRARLILAGLGFQEVYTYSLVSCELQRELLPLLGEEDPEKLVLANPITVDSSCIRQTLALGLLLVAKANRQLQSIKAFEIGDVIVPNESADVRAKISRRLGILFAAEKAGYEDIQAIVYALLRQLGDDVATITPHKLKMFIPGRSARLETRRGVRGVLGEVSPELLERLGIEKPVAYAELEYSRTHNPAAANR